MSENYERVTKSRRSPSQSYIVKGKLKLPSIPPNCFGFAVPHEITAEEINTLRADGIDFDPERDGKMGESWIGGISNKARYSYRRTTITKIDPKQDTAIAEIRQAGPAIAFDGQNGKTIANPSRIEALKDYYAKQKQTDPFTGNDFYTEENVSPFTVDLSERILNNRALLAVVLQETEHNELD